MLREQVDDEETRKKKKLLQLNGGEGGPHLGDVVAHTGLHIDEIVERHSAPLYPVYALGSHQRFRPPPRVWPLFLLNGTLDVIGNALFILAGQVGRMDVAAVLSSLYPGSTVLLAGLFLHERLSRPQLLGVLAALAAIILMTV